MPRVNTSICDVWGAQAASLLVSAACRDELKKIHHDPKDLVGAVSDCDAGVVLFQDRLMKFVPIVEIVQAHRVFWSGRVVVDPARAQDTLPRLTIVIVAAQCGVMFFDR